MATAYIGNPNNNPSIVWRHVEEAVTCLAASSSGRYATASTKYPTGETFTLASNQRVTGIRFTSGQIRNTDNDYKNSIRIYLCDEDGNNAHLLISKELAAVQHNAIYDPTTETWRDYTDYFNLSEINISGQDWRDLAGKKLALKKTAWSGHGVRSYCMEFIYQAAMQITVSEHAITWSNPSLTFSQNEYTLTVTKGGSASDNWGESIRYDLYMDGESVGTFSGNSMDITLTDDDLEVQHTFALYAVNSMTVLGCTETHTPQSVHKTVKYYDGTNWVECIASYYTGSEWVEVEPYYYNGSEWVLCSHT